MQLQIYHYTSNSSSEKKKTAGKKRRIQLKNKHTNSIPAILNGHIGSFPNGNFLKSFNGKYKMCIREITMSSTISFKPIIRSTKVSRSNNNGSPRNTPSQVLNTPNLKASSTDLTLFKQDCTECSCGFPVSHFLQVPITTSPTNRVSRFRGGVVGGSGGSPLCVGGGGGGRRGVVVVGAD